MRHLYFNICERLSGNIAEVNNSFFARWSQLVHLGFIQLTARSSRREGVASLKARFKNLYHLGAQPVSRCTFAEANNRRPACFFEALVGVM
jgi:hypothetical protein